MIDVNKLRRRCNMPISNFWGMGKVGDDGKGNRHVFIDRGGSILAVAHLDTVQKGEGFQYNRKAVASPRLDDRLGVYVILDLLPKLGVVCDVLLTENEEIGRSTARDFVADKEYNWIFEFDRGGTDAVMYDYENDHMIGLLETAGFVVGWGSYTDICDLEHLGVKGINFPVAYYNYHSVAAYTKIRELEDSVSKFLSFYDAHKDTRFPHTVVEKRVRYNYDRWGDTDWWKQNGKYDRWEGKATNKTVVDADECVVCGHVWWEASVVKYHSFNGETGRVSCHMPFVGTKLPLHLDKPQDLRECCPGCGAVLEETDINCYDLHGICAICYIQGVPAMKWKEDK